MKDSSTISWMMMGGPRDDEHSQDERHLGHMRALRESQDQAPALSFGAWLTRLVGFVGIRTAQPREALTADRCAVDGCLAA